MSLNKWIMMGLLVLVMGVITCAAPVAADCHDCSWIDIDDLRVPPNQPVEMNVRSNVVPAANGFQFEIWYPGDLLRYEGWDPGTLTRDSLITVRTGDPREAWQVLRNGMTMTGHPKYLDIAIADLSGISGEGSLIRLNFITLDPEETDSFLYTNGGTEITNEGTFDCTCIEYITVFAIGNIMGDCDGTGDINSRDALWALQMANGERAETSEADMDRDGNVELDDVLEILRQAATSTTHMRAATEKMVSTGPGQIPMGTTPTPVRTTATTPICAKGYTLCNSRCVNLLTDSTNCGACGKACATGQACSAGTCIASLRK